MTNFESVPIRDFDGAERLVGGQAVTQGADTIFHQTVLPGASVIREVTGITLSTTPYAVSLSGLETYLILDASQDNGSSHDLVINVKGKYGTGGSFVPVPMTPILGPEDMPSRHSYNFGINDGTRIPMGRTTVTPDAGRIWILAVGGLSTLEISTDIGTFTNVVIRSCIGTPPIQLTRTSTAKPSWLFSDNVTISTAYAAGDVIGGTCTVLGPDAPVIGLSLFELRSFAFADYGSGLGEFDVIFAAGDNNTALADSDALDLDYPESVFAWCEVRSAPTAGQFKLHDFGTSGGKGCIINDVKLIPPYTQPDATSGNVFLLDVIIVNRAGAITPAAGSGYFQGVVDF